MAYLIDTDIIINFLKEKSPLVSLTDFAPNNRLFVSVITWIEVVFGIKKRSPKSEKRLKEFEDFLVAFGIRISDLGIKTADRFVDLKIRQEKEGLPLADFDLLIAATAQANNLTLITGNKKRFSRIKNLKIA